MKRCVFLKTASPLLLFCILLAACASRPQGKVVRMAAEIPGDRSAADTQPVKSPEQLHVQAAKTSFTAIPSSNEDAAVFYYSLGQAYALDNETGKAIEAYRATLIYDPKSALVHARLAAELVKEGSLVEAKELCEKAITLDAKFIDSYLLLAGIHVAAKEYKKAIQAYRAALVQEPESRDALLYFGVTLAEVGQYPEALSKLEQLVGLKEKPESQIDQAVAKFYLAKVQQQAGHSAKAIATLEDALDKRPGFVKAAMLLSQIYETSKDTAKARKVLEDAFRESADTEIATQLAQEFLGDGKLKEAVVYLETLVENDADNENLRLKLGLVYWQLSWLDKAQKTLAEILARHPNSSEVLYYMAELELERGGAQDALAYYQRINPEYGKYEASVGRVVAIHRDAKKYAEAQNYLLEAISKRSDIVSFYPLLGAVYEEDKRMGDARAALELGQKKFPQDESILYYLGFLQDRMGDKQAGIETMETLLGINANNVNALNFLGYTMLEENRDLAKAKLYLTQAYRLKPNDAFIMDSYAWLLHKTNRAKEAMVILERAHGLKPEEAVLMEHLGDVYLSLNMKRKALDAFRKAYALGQQSGGESQGRVAAKVANLESTLVAQGTKLENREPANGDMVSGLLEQATKSSSRAPASIESSDDQAAQP